MRKGGSAHNLPRHVDDLLLELLALGLEEPDGLEEHLVAVPLAGALDGEDEVVPPAAQLDLALELGVPEALPADRVAHGVDDDGLGLAGAALVPAPRRGGLLGGHFLDADDALGEAGAELFGVGAQDGPQDADGGHEAVARRRAGGELGVVGADALVHVHGEVDGLRGPQLGDEHVGVHGGDGVGAAEVLDLVPRRHELDVARVDVGVLIRHPRVLFTGVRGLVDLARHVELQPHRVVVEAAGVRVRVVAPGAGLGLPVPPQVVPQALLAALERYQAQPVRQHLVLYHRRVVVDEDVLDGQRRHLGQHDAAEGVGDGGVDAHEREGRVELVVLVEVHLEPRPEYLEREGVVLAREVARVVRRDGVCHGFRVDAYGLHRGAPIDEGND